MMAGEAIGGSLVGLVNAAEEGGRRLWWSGEALDRRIE